MSAKLITRREFSKLRPVEQGYVAYSQGELPGSELKDMQKNPYHPGSRESNDWARGAQMAAINAQEGDD